MARPFTAQMGRRRRRQVPGWIQALGLVAGLVAGTWAALHGYVAMAVRLGAVAVWWTFLAVVWLIGVAVVFAAVVGLFYVVFVVLLDDPVEEH